MNMDQEKKTLENWMKDTLNCGDFKDLAERGHILLNLNQKTWYNYRHGITRRIPADVASRFNKELIKRNYQTYEF